MVKNDYLKHKLLYFMTLLGRCSIVNDVYYVGTYFVEIYHLQRIMQHHDRF